MPNAMRNLWFSLIAMTTLLSGCAHRIAQRGMDLVALQTKSEIREVFGNPAKVGVDENGNHFEEYRTRRNISEPLPMRCFGPGYGMAVIVTCGTFEVFCVSRELWLIGRRSVFGQTVRITYDGTDTVIDRTVDGERLGFCGMLSLTRVPQITDANSVEQNAQTPQATLPNAATATGQ